MVAATDLENFVVTDVFDRAPAPSWSKGRVTLLGDAAHPMSPFMGQGANMALEDGAVLAKCLKSDANIAAAVAAYESERLARTSKMVNQSRQIGTMGQWEHPAARLFRDAMMAVMTKVMPPEKGNDWLFSYNT